jgi:V8-like Glu-specific endopeptidase
MFLLLSYLAIVIASAQVDGDQTVVPDDKTIYGNDDRKDIFEVTNSLYLTLAASTVVLTSSSSLTLSNGEYTIRTSAQNVCPEAKFSDQRTAGFCSGTLISDRTILTAGHCIDASSCASTKFVFGFSVASAGVTTTKFPASDVVGCQSVISIEDSNNDLAIVTLDRVMTTRTPVTLATRDQSNPLPIGSPLLMIGHPSGLPTKVEDGGQICRNSEFGFYSANTDSFGGNSGSGVFDRTTGLLEGILVTGLSDYYTPSGRTCQLPVVFPNTDCGEGITKVSQVLVAMGAPAPSLSPTVFVARPSAFPTSSSCRVATPGWIADGYCDSSGGYNTEECAYDGGDCCPQSCVSTSSYSCGVSSSYVCLDPRYVTLTPTRAPSRSPTFSPTRAPSRSPTFAPTRRPTFSPTRAPTRRPTFSPTRAPSRSPTFAPTRRPTFSPTRAPTRNPTLSPTRVPTSFSPTSLSL